MGTNYYWRNLGQSNSVQAHIGKRSAAGLWCGDCGVPFMTGCTSEVHEGRDHLHTDLCPVCDSKEHSGNVRAVCSFTWTMLKHKRVLKMKAEEFTGEDIIIDEYGTLFTANNFLNMIKTECPIEFVCPLEFS